MARSQILKPEFWSDEKLALVPREARLTFAGLWTCSDDYGVTKGHPAWLKAQIFPYDVDLPFEEFGGWLADLERIGFTLEMLNRLVVIRKGITGLDPDLPEESQLRSWFQKRPERRDPSSGDQAARVRHLRKFSFRKKGSGKGSGGGLKRDRDGPS